MGNQQNKPAFPSKFDELFRSNKWETSNKGYQASFSADDDNCIDEKECVDNSIIRIGKAKLAFMEGNRLFEDSRYDLAKGQYLRA